MKVPEIFKSISQINPEFMWSFFKQKKLFTNLRKRPFKLNQELGPNDFHF